jgi:hypothetical protein
MPEQTPKPEEAIKQLENADSTELDDESLEDAAGGNGNCSNTSCCQSQQSDGS